MICTKRPPVAERGIVTMPITSTTTPTALQSVKSAAALVGRVIETKPKMSAQNKYVTTVLVRSQAEIIQRYREAGFNPGNRSIEQMEYTRIMSFHSACELGINEDITESAGWSKEGITEIDYSAKALLRIWETRIATGSLADSQRFTQMYVAFKWMLGHVDSDSIPGAFGFQNGGVMNCKSFQYIKDQILSGAWERLTKRAVANKRGE